VKRAAKHRAGSGMARRIIKPRICSTYDFLLLLRDIRFLLLNKTCRIISR
jgi:hypothetical protein